MKTWLPLFVALGISIMITKRGWQIPEKGRKFQSTFLASERKYNLPHNLLARVAYQESRFRDDIINGETQSSAGAQGLMQIIPRWHPEANPLDPFDSIDYAGFYLRKLFNQFGSWDKALGAYNWGPGNLKRALETSPNQWLALAPTETQNYVNQITNDIV